MATVRMPRHLRAPGFSPATALGSFLATQRPSGLLWPRDGPRVREPDVPRDAPDGPRVREPSAFFSGHALGFLRPRDGPRVFSGHATALGCEGSRLFLWPRSPAEGRLRRSRAKPLSADDRSWPQRLPRHQHSTQPPQVSHLVSRPPIERTPPAPRAAATSRDHFAATILLTARKRHRESSPLPSALFSVSSR